MGKADRGFRGQKWVTKNPTKGWEYPFQLRYRISLTPAWRGGGETRQNLQLKQKQAGYHKRRKRLSGKCEGERKKASSYI